MPYTQPSGLGVKSLNTESPLEEEHPRIISDRGTHSLVIMGQSSVHQIGMRIAALPKVRGGTMVHLLNAIMRVSTVFKAMEVFGTLTHRHDHIIIIRLG